MPRLIALAMPASRAFVDQLRQCWDLGDAVFPIDMRLPVESRIALARSMGAAEVRAGSDVMRLDEPVPTQQGDALVVATSGTTGLPKGVVLTHEAVAASARLTTRALGIDARHSWVQCLPVNHIGGLSVITRAIITETPLMIVDGGFSASAVEDFARRGGTHVSLVSTAMRRIDTTLFDCILLGGGPRPSDAPANAVATYGSTETGSGVVYDGKVLDGVELRTDDNGRLFVKSPTLLRSYRDGTTPLTEDGWLRTGDAATIGDDGQLAVHGRFDDAIITGGEKVWPALVESVLRLVPGVADALVFGEPDPEWGERVAARIELTPGTNAMADQAINEHVRSHLASYSAPKRYEFGPLERTGSGKVKRAVPPSL